MKGGFTFRGLALAACALTVVAGCGAGAGDEPAAAGAPAATSTAEASPTPAPDLFPSDLPRPAVPLGDTLTAFGQALRTGECSRIGVFVTTRQRDPDAKPGAAPDTKECGDLEKFLNPLGAFAHTSSQEFGTAAVVDGTLNGAVVTTLWVLDSDRRWRIDPTAYVYPTPEDPDVHSVGTAPRPGNRFAENAQAWIAAWRRGECEDVFRLTDPFSAFVADNGGTEAELCLVVTDSFTGNGIGGMLAANPTATPEVLGAVDQYGFSLLRAADGSMFTIVSIVQATNASPAERAAHDNYGVYNIYRARAADPAKAAPPSSTPPSSTPPSAPPTRSPSASPTSST